MSEDKKYLAVIDLSRIEPYMLDFGKIIRFECENAHVEIDLEAFKKLLGFVKSTDSTT